MLDLADVRAHRWRQRLRETGTLEAAEKTRDAAIASIQAAAAGGTTPARGRRTKDT